MPHYRRICGEKCYLSPSDASDAERIKAWENDLQVLLGASMDGVSTPASTLYRAPDQPAKLLDHMMMIVDLETDTPIGWCALFCNVPVNRRASLGIIIGETSYWGRGYGQEAVRLLLDYGFNVLGLNSVELGVYAFNRRAIRCYEKVGFQQTGVRRQARIVAGIPHDTISMDILSSEFETSHIAQAIDQSKGERT